MRDFCDILCFLGGCCNCCFWLGYVWDFLMMMEYWVCEYGGCMEDFLKVFIYKDFVVVFLMIVLVIGYMDCWSKERIMRVEGRDILWREGL